jgi:hypothetical protein
MAQAEVRKEALKEVPMKGCHVAHHHASQNQLDKMEARSFDVWWAFWKENPKDLKVMWPRGLKYLELELEEVHC